MSFNLQKDERKRVVIVGGGIGGLELAKRLEGSNMQVVLIDKNNYHQFPPLLYQVATSGLEESSISFPFRRIFRKSSNICFRMAEARCVFPELNILQTSIGKIEYDYLVFAAGTTTNFFGNKNIEENAMPMKTVSEALGLRNALLSNWERADTCATEEERQELLNVVIVGGGATGVEVAGALAQMKQHVFPVDYPDLDMKRMHIYLIEAGDRLLAGMSPDSSAKTQQFLEEMGVEVMLHKMVTDFKDYKIYMKDGSVIPTRTFIWVSGVRANFIEGLPKDVVVRGGRLAVDAFNCVKDTENIFAIGDQCLQTTDEAYPNGHPQLAQVAIQQGRNLADNLKRIVAGRAQEVKAFKYNDLGSMATVGRNRAVAEIGKVHTQGFGAWMLWLFVHLRSILGVRNKIIVFLNWMWSYLTYDNSIRMIVFPTKSKILRERDKREQSTHWGEDLLEATKAEGEE